jgi:hypothetical protein
LQSVYQQEKPNTTFLCHLPIRGKKNSKYGQGDLVKTDLQYYFTIISEYVLDEVVSPFGIRSKFRD